MKPKARKLFALLAALLLVAAACGNDDADPDTNDTDGAPATTDGNGDGVAAEAGTLTIGWSTLGNESMNPPDTSATQDLYLDAIFDYLTYIVRDSETFEVEPGLATAYEPNDDLTVWTFTLRDDVDFHNGDPLTSTDVVYSIEAFSDEESVAPRAPFLRSAIESMDTPDDHTVVFNLARPIADFPMQLSDLHSTSILPSQYHQDVGAQEFARAPIGSGPYRFDSQSLGSSVTFEALDSHWRQDPSYQGLVFRLFEDPSARINALQSGEVDIIDMPADFAGQVESGGGVIVEVPNALNEWINLGGLLPEDHPNYDPDTPWLDPQVREAMSVAIDREAIADIVYAGFANPAGVAMWIPGARGFPDESVAPAPEFDPERAEELLADAGYPDGFEINLHLFDFPPATQLVGMGEAVAQMWGDVGITANINRTTFAGIREPIADRSMTDDAWTFRLAQFPDLTESIPLFWQTDGNFPVANSPELDDLVDQLLATVGVEDREQAMNELIVTAAENTYAIPVVYSSQLTAKDPAVGSWPIFPGLGYKLSYAFITPAGS